MSIKLTQTLTNALADAAVAAKKHSYSPYSRFKVGAAVLTEDGTIYSGTNIENASYGLTICAERTAMVKALSEGHRHFIALAVCTDAVKGGGMGTPCGACRQFMSEFMHPADTVLFVSAPAKGARKIVKKKMKDVLPYPFGSLL